MNRRASDRASLKPELEAYIRQTNAVNLSEDCGRRSTRSGERAGSPPVARLDRSILLSTPTDVNEMTAFKGLNRLPPRAARRQALLRPVRRCSAPAAPLTPQRELATAEYLTPKVTGHF